MIKKTYPEVPKQLICPNCSYEEENNLTRCRCECSCGNLVLSKSDNFDELTDRYCTASHGNGYGTCLQFGENERARGIDEELEYNRNIRSGHEHP